LHEYKKFQFSVGSFLEHDFRVQQYAFPFRVATHVALIEGFLHLESFGCSLIGDTHAFIDHLIALSLFLILVVDCLIDAAGEYAVVVFLEIENLWVWVFADPSLFLEEDLLFEDDVNHLWLFLEF
jgi:hypothetical protein